MDFDFSDDQEQLRDAVRKWVDKGYSFDRRRAAEKAGGFDRAAYTELAALGLTGLYVPEDDGGMGMGPVEGMVVMEELGRGIVLEPLAQSLIAGAVIAGYGDTATKAAWLSAIASGEKLVVLAYQERAARYQLNICEAKGARWLCVERYKNCSGCWRPGRRLHRVCQSQQPVGPVCGGA
jgi:alkylation response protein AidB-like acyl-CoA dehydrogenase